MVPGSSLSVLFFVLFVAPGLLFELLSRRRRAGVAESAFVEVSRIVLASLAFSGFALGTLSVVRTLRPDWMADPGGFFRHGNAYLADHYRIVLRTFLIEGILSLGAA